MAAALPAAAAGLPAKVKNTLYLPSVWNQGAVSNCAVYASTYYLKTYQEAREHGWVRPDPAKQPERCMTPGFVFPIANGASGEAVNVTQVLGLICRYGVSTWKDGPAPQNAYDYPSEAQWRAAARFRGERVVTFETGGAAGFNALKARLAAGDLVVAGFPMFFDTFDAYPAGAGTDTATGVLHRNGSDRHWTLPHALTVIGYDDNKAYTGTQGPRTGAFLAVNSWGTEWGVLDPDVGTRGFVWIAYDYFREHCQGAATMDDRLGYAPRDWAVIDLQHDTVADLHVFITAGVKDATAPWLEAFHNGGALEPYHGRVVIDVTDFTSLDPLSYWLRVEDNMGYGVGAITGFEVQRAGGRVLRPSAERLPLRTPDGGTAILAAGWFEAPPAENPLPLFESAALAATDFDNDGDLDALLSGKRRTDGAVITMILRNQGTSWGQEATGLPGVLEGDVVTADFDGDGWADVALAGDGPEATGPRLEIWRQDATGGFARLGEALPPAGVGQRIAPADFDNDGDPDLLVCGSDFARIYRNDGGGFAAVEVGFAPGPYQPVSWADFDNDGRPDPTVGGEVFHNNGDGTFSLAAAIQAGFRGAHAWGDLNGDGLLDLATTMLGDGEPGIRPTLYRNDGVQFIPEGAIPGRPAAWILNLTPIEGTLAGVSNGSLAWADFDLDGRLELAANGATGLDASGGFTDLFRQAPAGGLERLGLDLPPIVDGHVIPGDFDRDGCVDLLAVGTLAGNAPAPELISSIVANQAGLHSPGLASRIGAPSVPVGLRVLPETSEGGGTASAVRLGWDRATDPLEPAASLRYQLRIGTVPGAGDVLSSVGEPPLGGRFGLLDTSPLLEFDRMFRTNGTPGARLVGLAAGRYWWSVRSLNARGAISAWSEEASFVVGTSGVVTGDLNEDGVIDVADLVTLQRMADEMAPPEAGRADLNADGRVDAADVHLLSARLLSVNAGGFLPLAVRLIGPAGGTLAVDGMELEFPVGALDVETAVEVAWADGVSDGGAIESRYRVTGLPMGLAVPIRLRLPLPPGNPPQPLAAPFALVGPESPLLSLGGTVSRPAFDPVEGVVVRGTRTEFLLGPAELSAGTLGSDFPSAIRTLRGRLPAGSSGTAAPAPAIQIKTVPTWYAEARMRSSPPGHFKVWTNLPQRQAQLDQLVAELEKAHDLITGGLGLQIPGQQPGTTANPLLVQLFHEPVTPASPEPNYGDCSARDIRINDIALTNITALQATVIHELFHVFQYNYGFFFRDSTPDVEDAWLGDALSSWSEELNVAQAGYFPELLERDMNRLEMFRGFAVLPAATVQSPSPMRHHGYGLPGMIKHLVRTFGTNTVAAIFYNRRFGHTTIDSVLNSLPANADPTGWHHPMFIDWLQGRLFPTETDQTMRYQALARSGPLHRGLHHIFTLNTTNLLALNNPLRKGGVETPVAGMGGTLFKVFFDYRETRPQPLASDLVLAVKARIRPGDVSDGSHLRLSVLTELPAGNPLTSSDTRRTVEPTVRAGSYHPARKVCRAVVSDLETLRKTWREVLVLVSNSDPDCPMVPDLPLQFSYGLCRPVEGPVAFPDRVADERPPNLQTRETLTLPPMLAYVTNRLNNIGQNQVYLDVWQEEGLALPVSLECTPTETSWVQETRPGASETVTFLDVETYEAVKGSYPVQGMPVTVIGKTNNPGGRLDLTLAEEEDAASFSLAAVCRVRYPDASIHRVRRIVAVYYLLRP